MPLFGLKRLVRQILRAAVVVQHLLVLSVKLLLLTSFILVELVLQLRQLDQVVASGGARG